ncbi:MAG: serine protease [Magnetospirillum sp.]|nr:serine protease [Magnetospirillum sp.]
MPVLVLAALIGMTRLAPAEDLAIGLPPRTEFAPNATGFFIDMEGTVLTARHAVEGCRNLYTLKDSRVARAELVAVSKDSDLALVRRVTCHGQLPPV